MAGTKEGAIKARNSNIEKHGKDFYKSIGQVGGKVSNPLKGFGGMSREKVQAAGRKGGAISKRGSRSEQS